MMLGHCKTDINSGFHTVSDKTCLSLLKFPMHQSFLFTLKVAQKVNILIFVSIHFDVTTKRKYNKTCLPSQEDLWNMNL